MEKVSTTAHKINPAITENGKTEPEMAMEF